MKKEYLSEVLHLIADSIDSNNTDSLREHINNIDKEISDHNNLVSSPDFNSLVISLRNMSGCGLVACKKAIIDCKGDVDSAYKKMRGY